MGQGTTRLENTNGSSARVRELGNETDGVRRELDELVMELDRRRHQALDWRLQVRRHARPLALLGAGLVVVVGSGVAVSIARNRRRQTLAARVSDLTDWAERLRLALGRIVADPDRLASKEPPRRRIDAALPYREVGRGRSLVVIGGSGTGKSVMLKCVLGILRPTLDQGAGAGNAWPPHRLPP
jgi:ABC-type uncharacterized transport system fused permease/ATPase subunit